jgi:3',5'-cyclic AMP phosphodiesterase CpdA
LQNVRPRDLLNKRALGYLSWRRKRRFEHRPEVLEALARDLADNPIDQLLVTGDLTHIGLPQEFAQARDWLQSLGDPAHVALIPGNHDACVKAGWDETFGLWREYMASDHDGADSAAALQFPSLRIRGQLAFIGLSTACPTPPLMATGTLGAAQLERLPALLQSTAAAGLFRVVYLHHSPLPGHEKWRKRLTDAPEILALLQDFGAELVLHGHGHRAQYSEVATRSGTLPVIAAPSASALGLHGADVAHYNLYRVKRSDHGWTLDIDSRRYRPESAAFTTGEHRELHIARSRH